METAKGRRWKCRATGKVGFPSMIEAQGAMLQFKFKSRIRNKTDGKRIKHRMGKYACKRAYYCKLCRGYHITKWDTTNFNNYKTKVESWEIKDIHRSWNYVME